jgi:hypothetical protein
MGDISVGSGGATTRVVMPAAPVAEHALSKIEELNVTISDGDHQYKVSAEAQYLFEMQRHLQQLDTEGQEKALEYLAQSNNPLQNKVIESFRRSQAFAEDIRTGKIKIVRDESEELRAKNLLNSGLIIDGKTEIGVRPNGIDVFRLDGKQHYFPAAGNESNPALFKQLETLEKAVSGLLRNRDAANVFGSVSNALVYSEHILLSADDVLHYNYAIEKTRKTIEFVNAPAKLKTALSQLLDKGIAWQDAKQSRTISANRQLANNNHVGHQAAEAVRMGSAAQAFNQQLVHTFKSSTLSLLDSSSLVKRMLVEQPDLIRFNASKIDEALQYYRDDFVHYEKALNADSVLPPAEWKSPFSEQDKKLFAASKGYALKIIGEIEGYVANK